MLVHLALTLGAGHMTGTIGGAAGPGLCQLRLAEGQSAHHHAMVEQGIEHAQQCAFLPPMHGRGRGEYRRGLVDERAGEPQGGGAIDEVLHGRGHVAEAGRAADDQSRAVAQVVLSAEHCARLWHGGCGGFGDRGHGRHCSEPSLHLSSACQFHPTGNQLRHAGSGAVTAVIQHQYIGCLWLTHAVLLSLDEKQACRCGAFAGATLYPLTGYSSLWLLWRASLDCSEATRARRTGVGVSALATRSRKRRSPSLPSSTLSASDRKDWICWRA